MAADSSSSASDANFDTENDAFDDYIYFGDSGDNVQEIEIVLLVLVSPVLHHTGMNRL